MTIGVHVIERLWGVIRSRWEDVRVRHEGAGFIARRRRPSAGVGVSRAQILGDPATLREARKGVQLVIWSAEAPPLRLRKEHAEKLARAIIEGTDKRHG